MKSYCLTDKGIKREMNQDFVYASEQSVGNLPNLFIVADGMGGHAAGDLASRCAVETMVDHISGSPLEKPVSLLDEAVKAANAAVVQRASSDKSLTGMGTTLVACSAQRGCLYIANVGDSRLYLLDENIEQITKDHSLVEEMVRAGQLAREDARTHPEKNVITRAIGVKNNLQADYFDIPLHEGDIVLLCSDGLSNMVTDQEMLRIVKKSTCLEDAAKKLVEAANRNGGADNISVVLIEPEAGEVSAC